MSEVNQVEKLEDVQNSPAGEVQRWLSEIRLAKRAHKQFYERAKAIIKRYTAETDDAVDDEKEASPDKSQYNIFWSNLETLKPAVFSQTPKAVVTRRHNDKNPLGRMVAEVEERGIDTQMESEVIDPIFERVELEWFLTGRGMVWVRYCPMFREIPERVGLTYVQSEGQEGGQYFNPSGEVYDGDAEQDEVGHYYNRMQRQVADERVKIDQVAWDDYLHNEARNESEVRWKSRRVRMTRSELESRFGEKAKDVSLAWRSSHEQAEVSEKDHVNNEFFQVAEVWEIWDIDAKEVIWISEGYSDGPLDKTDDPLRLKGFFPCPPALLDTTGPNSMIPVPDYAIYQDQLRYLETLDRRIQLLTAALAVRGVRDSSVPEPQNLISHTPENKLIPIANFARLVEKGGLAGVIDFFPLEVIANALMQLVDLKAATKRDLYEISGMADIIRGTSDPRETARAQGIKGRFATLRLEEKQRRFTRFCKQTAQIVGEIIAEHFRPQTLARIAGVDQLTPEVFQQFEQIVAVLRSDKLRSYHIDIELESTIAVDEETTKKRVNEFLATFGKVMNQALPLVQAVPEMAVVVKELIMLAVRQHRVGRTVEGRIEEALDEAVARVKQRQEQPDQQQQDPQIIKIKQDFQIKMQELEMKRQAQMADQQRENQEMQLEVQKTMAEIQKVRAQIASITQRAQSEVARDTAAAERDLMMAATRAAQATMQPANGSSYYGDFR